MEGSSIKDKSTSLAPVFDNGSSLLANWEDDEDLQDLLENEDIFEEKIIFAKTPSKAFANEHVIEISMVGKEVYNNINLDIPEAEFENILIKYKEYISPIRKQMIVKLLIQRYKNIKKRAILANKTQ